MEFVFFFINVSTGGRGQYSYVGAIIAYILTEGAVGTGGSHFESQTAR
jgi:hypothetical protein